MHSWSGRPAPSSFLQGLTLEPWEHPSPETKVLSQVTSSLQGSFCLVMLGRASLHYICVYVYLTACDQTAPQVARFLSGTSGGLESFILVMAEGAGACVDLSSVLEERHHVHPRAPCGEEGGLSPNNSCNMHVHKIDHFNHFKCTVQRHQARSHCGATITSIHLQGFSLHKLKLSAHS